MTQNEEAPARGPARSSPRDSLFLMTSFTTLEGAPLGKARVRNLSASGLMADCERAIPVDARVVFELRGVGRVKGVIAWSKGDKVGIAFESPIDPQLARRPVSSGTSASGMPDYLRIPQQGRR